MTSASAAILVVDDNENNRYTLSRRLKRQATRDLATADERPRGARVAAARPFDLVLLDIMMPEIDGYRGARADQGRPGAARHPGHHDLGRQRDRQRRALHRARRRGLPAQAVQPRAAEGAGRRLPGEQAPARPRGRAPRRDRGAAAAGRRAAARDPAGAGRERAEGDRRSRRGGTRTSRCCSATSSASPRYCDQPGRRRSSPSWTCWSGRARTRRRGTGWRRSRPSATPPGDGRPAASPRRPGAGRRALRGGDDRGPAAAARPRGTCGSASTSARSSPASSAGSSSSSTSGATR